jgi:hypothetical protein
MYDLQLGRALGHGGQKMIPGKSKKDNLKKAILKKRRKAADKGGK